MAHEVFICHASRDKTVAEAVCATLESKHIRCWIAPRDVLPGALWGEAIADAIDGSHIVVLVLSSSSCSSPQVIREVERAASNNTPIVPLRIDNVSLPRAIGFFVNSRHWLDAQTPPLRRHLQRLADTVQRLLAQERVPQKSIEVPETKEEGGRGQERLKTGLEVKTGFFPLSWALYFCKPIIVVDDTVYQAKWGLSFFELEPGRHAVKIFFRYLFIPECGANSISVLVEQGKVSRVRYSGPDWIFGKGHIKTGESYITAQEPKGQIERAKREAEEKSAVSVEKAVETAEAVQQVLHCPECGVELRPNASFCNRCGARVSEGGRPSEAEEKVQKEAEERAQKEAEEKAQKEAEEKAQKEAEERAQKEAEEKAQKEAEEKAQREAEEKAQREAEEKAKKEAAKAVQQVLHCPECGVELRPNASFCNKCGARISEGEEEESVVAVEQVVEDVEIVQQVLHCPECGIELRPDASFCNKCGARISEGEEEESVVAVEQVVEDAETVQQVLHCPECGIELRPDASFCDKCGARVSEGEKDNK